MLRKPKEVTIATVDEGEKTYVFSRFDCIAGREICSQYPISIMPKIGDYKLSEELMLKLMCHVGIPREGAEPLMLVTKELVRNHVPEFETLGKIEIGMMEYNVSFFRDGKSLVFFADIGQTLKAWTSSMLTGLLDVLSQVEKRRSTN